MLLILQSPPPKPWKGNEVVKTIWERIELELFVPMVCSVLRRLKLRTGGSVAFAGKCSLRSQKRAMTESAQGRMPYDKGQRGYVFKWANTHQPGKPSGTLDLTENIIVRGRLFVLI